MTTGANGTPGPHAGLNAPSGVTRVLMTGFYDGATDGLLQFGDGPVFRFDLLDPDEDHAERLAGRAERSFVLRPLPDDALDRFVAALAPYMTPRWPAWCPLWSFPTDDVRREVEARTDAILARAGPPEWTIATADYAGFSAFRAERPLAVNPV